MKELLFDFNRKLILEHLRNVNIETWRREGLFRRCRKLMNMRGDDGQITREVTEISVGDKMSLCQSLITGWFNPKRRLNTVRNPQPLPMQEKITERHLYVAERLNPVSDNDFLPIFSAFLFTEKPVGAKYFAKKKHIDWKTFVDSFNKIIEEIWEAENETRTV